MSLSDQQDAENFAGKDPVQYWLQQPSNDFNNLLFSPVIADSLKMLQTLH